MMLGNFFKKVGCHFREVFIEPFRYLMRSCVDFILKIHGIWKMFFFIFTKKRLDVLPEFLDIVFRQDKFVLKIDKFLFANIFVDFMQ